MKNKNYLSYLQDGCCLFQPPQLELRVSGSTTPPLQSPATDGESVFTDGEEWPHPHPKKPPVNWETFPRPSDRFVNSRLSSLLFIYMVENG